ITYRTGIAAPVLLALLMMMSQAFVARAQEVTGSLIGTVRDSNGATIAGAKLTITDAEKRAVVRVVTANGDGQFSAPLLQAGVYDIEVEAAGFKRRVERAIKLDLNQRRSVDVILEIGAVSEVVTVEASAIAVETSTPTVSTLIGGAQIRELSLNNRNWVQ